MTRKITIMALIAGVVLGAASTGGFAVYRQSRQSQSSRIFQQRIHCNAVAEAYVKENSDRRDKSLVGTNVMLDKVGYSPARNSCVAEMRTDDFGGASEQVQDLLSGETLFTVTSEDYLETFMYKHWVDSAFDYAMNNADKPVELEREYAQMRSIATPHASPATEPTDWQTVPATENDALGKPITSTRPSVKGNRDFYPDTGKPIQEHGTQRKSAAPSSP